MTSVSELCGRLRKGRPIKASEEVTLIIDGHETKASTGELREVYPLGAEAADLIEAQAAEIARLRNALSGLMDHPEVDLMLGGNPVTTQMVADAARAALANTPAQQEGE